MKGLSNSFRYTYNKLVRDRIPENIDSEPGRKSQYRILDDTEYMKELNKVMKSKAEKKGAFDNKIFLEYVDEEKRNLEEEKELNKDFRK